MAEGFITRRGGVAAIERTASPSINFVSKTQTQIVVTFTNTEANEVDIFYGITSTLTDKVTVAASGTSSNVTFSGLDLNTPYTVSAYAIVTDATLKKIKSEIVSTTITTPIEVPQTISNLFAWYDATKITGLSNNDVVATWSDSSGNNDDLTQSTPAKRPTYKTNVRNSLPVVRFDGTDDTLVNSTAISQANTTFLVYKYNSFANSNQMIFDSNSAPNRQILFTKRDGDLNIHAGSDVDTGFNSTTNFAYTTVVFNTTSSFVRLNGSQSGTLSPGSNTRIGISLAAHQQDTQSTSAYTNIDIAEIIIYDKVCSGTEITDVENYLTSKWGL